jgi:hypothetical protein
MDLENSLFRLVDGRNIVGSPELLDERTPYGTAVFAVVGMWKREQVYYESRPLDIDL